MNVHLCRFLQTTKSFHIQSLRTFKSDLKIKWVRPAKIPCIKPEKSGDVGQLPQIPLDTYVLKCNNSTELASATPEVQSLFRLSQNPRIEISRWARENLTNEVKRHSLDYGSTEAKLARMTATIRRLQELLDDFPKNVRMKVILKELIDKRKKLLKFLRRWDYKRFEWVLEKLDLVYKPPPPKFHMITRKESLQKLTTIHCEKLRQERLNAYREELEVQQIPFLENAIKKMKFIRNEQIDLQIPLTATDKEINELEQQLEQLKDLRNETTTALNKIN